MTSFSDDITGTGIRPDIKSQPIYNVPGVNTCRSQYMYMWFHIYLLNIDFCGIKRVKLINENKCILSAMSTNILD